MTAERPRLGDARQRGGGPQRVGLAPGVQVGFGVVLRGADRQALGDLYGRVVVAEPMRGYAIQIIREHGPRKRAGRPGDPRVRRAAITEAIRRVGRDRNVATEVGRDRSRLRRAVRKRPGPLAIGPDHLPGALVGPAFGAILPALENPQAHARRPVALCRFVAEASPRQVNPPDLARRGDRCDPVRDENRRVEVNDRPKRSRNCVRCSIDVHVEDVPTCTIIVCQHREISISWIYGGGLYRYSVSDIDS